MTQRQHQPNQVRHGARGQVTQANYQDTKVQNGEEKSDQEKRAVTGGSILGRGFFTARILAFFTSEVLDGPARALPNQASNKYQRDVDQKGERRGE